MKVLIADDERLECEALEKMLSINFPEAEVLPSVYDGAELVQKVEEVLPDIVIVDINMPNLDGLTALEILHEKHDELKVIIHSAYNYFEYIHKALLLGVADYLVKPVFEEDFVKVFQKVAKPFYAKEKNVPLQRIKKDMRDMSGDNVMMQLLLGQRPDKKSWQRLVEDNSGQQKGYVLALSIRGREDSALFYSLITTRLKDNYTICSIMNKGVLYCLIFTEDLSRVDRFLNPVARQYNLDCRCGISSLKEDYSQFVYAVMEADAARKNAQKNISAYYQQCTLTVLSNPFERLAETIGELLTSNKPEEAVDMTVRQIESSRCGEEIQFVDLYYTCRLFVQASLILHMTERRTGMKWTVAERVKDMLNAFYGIGQGDIPKEEKAELLLRTSVPKTEWRDYIHKIFIDLMEDLKLPLRGRNPYVDQAVHDIKTNYMKDLSLEQTAGVVGITQFYLSRLLKQERNQTFTEILTDVRIDRALQLMETPYQSLPAISESVGYNVKYFTQVFRNTMKLSPRIFYQAFWAGEESNR